MIHKLEQIDAKLAALEILMGEDADPLVACCLDEIRALIGAKASTVMVAHACSEIVGYDYARQEARQLVDRINQPQTDGGCH